MKSCDVCGRTNIMEYPALGSNCEDCNPLLKLEQSMAKKPPYYKLTPEGRVSIDSCLKDLSAYYDTCAKDVDWENFDRLTSVLKGENSISFKFN